MDFIGIPKNERTLKYAQINEESLKRTIVFDIEKKNEVFVNKIETEEEMEQRKAAKQKIK